MGEGHCIDNVIVLAVLSFSELLLYWVHAPNALFFPDEPCQGEEVTYFREAGRVAVWAIIGLKKAKGIPLCVHACVHVCVYVCMRVCELGGTVGAGLQIAHRYG